MASESYALPSIAIHPGKAEHKPYWEQVSIAGNDAMLLACDYADFGQSLLHITTFAY